MIPRLRPDERIADAGGRFSDLVRRWVLEVTRTLNGESAPTWPRIAKAQLGTPATSVGQVVIVTDDVGGEVPAWCDGAAWRRMTDRAEIV